MNPTRKLTPEQSALMDEAYRRGQAAMKEAVLALPPYPFGGHEWVTVSKVKALPIQALTSKESEGRD